MSPNARLRLAAALTAFAALGAVCANAQDDDRQIKHVFVIALENHNWTQPTTVAGGIEQIYQNPNAPFINSLVNGTAQAYINGQVVNISKQVSYASAYHNVLATPSGNNLHIHPSEPNYIWAEAGTNFGILNDDDPFKDTPPNSQATTQHLSGLLQAKRISWKSYQEDIDLQTAASGSLTNLPLPASQWTSPIVSHSGVFDAASNLNESNATLQYNYAVKHNPEAFFNDTNGGNNTTTSNTERFHYAPLQQLAIDLASNNVAAYNWITPDQYNDQHSSLSTPFVGLTGDAQNIKEGDNAIARLVPLIMASPAYRDGGVIVLWWDEAEDDGEANDNADDFNHTIGEIVISPLAHSNEGGKPYASSVPFSHSSDLRTWQEVFHVRATGASPFLGDAVNATDLSDLFEPGVIPSRP